MTRTELEMILHGVVKRHIEVVVTDLKNLTDDEKHLAVLDSFQTTLLRELWTNHLRDDLANIAEAYAIGQDNQIAVRATVAGYAVPADSDKPIVVKVEAPNTTQARVQLAMLRGASVDLTGCQGELYTAGDLGITLADDQAEFDLEGVA